MVVAIYGGIYRLPASFKTWQAPTFYKPFPKKVCFRPLRLRDGALPASHARFGLFGLSMNGFPLQGGRCLAPDNGFAACVDYPVPVPANGYFFDTGTSGSPSTDPVSWSVEANSGNETLDSWKMIGASTWLIHFSGMHYHFPSLPYSTPMQRNARVAISIIPPWQWGFAWLGTQVIQLCGTAALAMVGVTGCARWGRTVMVVTLASIATIFLVSGAGYQAEHRYRDALFLYLAVIPSGVLAVGVMFWEAKILTVLSGCAAAFFITICLHYAILFPDSHLLVTTLIFGLSTWLLILISIGMFIRRKALLAAHKLVEADTAVYERLWRNLMCDPGARIALIRLGIAAEQLRCRGYLAQGAPRQYKRKASCGHCPWQRCVETSFLGGGGIPATTDYVQGASSLDQMYVQAELLNPVLLERVKEWALMSSGCFPVLQPKDQGVSYVRWSISLDSKTQIRWGKLKSVARAVEKLVRSYDQVDVASIVIPRI